MLKNMKNRLKSRLSDTVFGNASSGMKYLYEKNKKVLYVQMILVLVAAIILTGYGVLFIMNLGGNAYLVNLRNMFAAWFNKGILISLLIFVFLEMVFFRFLLLFTTSYKKDEDRNYDVSNEGTYGTNSTMSEEEMKKTFNLGTIEEIKDPIFGKNPYNTLEVVGQKHPLLKINRNVLMVSGPSGGKSATYVIPLLFQIIRSGMSAIVSDPKSELFKIVSELAKMLGYEVRILNLNPMFLENSDPCNFMMYVGDDVDKAQVMSNAIIANTTGGEAMLDFWSEGALNLLQALILRISVGTDFRPEEKNLPMIFTYVTGHSLEDMETDFLALPRTHPAYAPFRIFADGEEKVKKQVLQGLRIKLKLFNSPKLRTILSATEGNIDILNPGRRRCMYFVGSNDQDSSMSAIVSLFYTLLYQELVRYADTRLDQELPVTVHMVLDEYANMGTIPSFEKKLSTVRSRNIITHIIIQDINQLKTKHPEDTWRTVMNDIDYYLMLKTNDPETMKWWSEMSGEQTINVKNRRYERNKMDVLGIHAQESITEGQGTRQVFTTGEVRSLKDDEVLLLISQRNMVKLKTFYWAADHPYGRYIKEHEDKMYVLPAQHYPFWRLIRDGVVDKDFDYDHEPSFVIELEKDEKMVIDEDYDPDSILKVKNRGAKGIRHKTAMMGKDLANGVKREIQSRSKAAKNAVKEKAKDEMFTVKDRIMSKKLSGVKDEKTVIQAEEKHVQPEIRFIKPKEPAENMSKMHNMQRDRSGGDISKKAGHGRENNMKLLSVEDMEESNIPVSAGNGEEIEAPDEANAADAFTFLDNMESLDEFINKN